MFRGLRMAMDTLAQHRLLKGILSKKAVAAQAKEVSKLSCHKCNRDHGVTLRKYGVAKYICTHCDTRVSIPTRRERRQG